MKPVPFDPAAVAYHEIRGPLGLLVTAARAAAEEAPEGPLRAQVETIARAGERLLRTASEILRPAESAGDVVCPAPVIQSLVSSAGAFGQAVELRIGPGAADAPIRGTPATLEALVQSLLNNAADHGQRGARVVVSLRRTAGTLELSVVNNLAHHDGHDGLGMGAAIADALAGALGARVDRHAGRRRFRASVRFAVQNPVAGISALAAASE